MKQKDYFKKEKKMFQYQFNDGGRSQSKRPKQKNDCTVRALAVSAQMSYDDAYTILKKYGRVSFTLTKTRIEGLWYMDFGVR